MLTHCPSSLAPLDLRLQFVFATAPPDAEKLFGSMRTGRNQLLTTERKKTLLVYWFLTLRPPPLLPWPLPLPFVVQWSMMGLLRGGWGCHGDVWPDTG